MHLVNVVIIRRRVCNYERLMDGYLKISRKKSECGFSNSLIHFTCFTVLSTTMYLITYSWKRKVIFPVESRKCAFPSCSTSTTYVNSLSPEDNILFRPVNLALSLSITIITSYILSIFYFEYIYFDTFGSQHDRNEIRLPLRELVSFMTQIS